MLVRENDAARHRPVQLAIVGGGPAGLFAAVTARERRLDCLLFERKARIGSKLLMTANGRCNFTKDISAERMLADIGEPVAAFVAPALRAFPPERVQAFFRARRLRLKRMADGRIFPASEKAADVTHVFGDFLRDSEIPLLTNAPVTGIRPVRNGFIVATHGFTVWAQNVLVATGGLSFPKTGSVGDGQRFAAELGLALEPCRAGLVGCDTPDDAAVTARAGRTLERAAAAVLADGIERFRAEGELDFEPTGVSGASVYNCTRYAARHRLAAWSLALETPEGRHVVARPVMRPVKEAIVTVGGVSREAVDPATMGARAVPGLYFAGEVLDVDGPTGGYNVTLAFATARLAVNDIARRLNRRSP